MTDDRIITPAEKLGLVVQETHQDETAWRKARQSLIGSSDAAALFHAEIVELDEPPPFRTPLKLYADKAGLIDDHDETESMRWGKALEPAVALEVERRESLRLVIPPEHTLYRRTDKPFIGASPDRLLLGPALGLLEIKTTGSWRDDDWADKVPLVYQVQVQHQMMVLGITWGFVAVLIGGQRLRTFQVQADAEFHSILLERVVAFWGRVERREPPQPIGADLDTVRKLYQREQPGKVAELTHEADVLADAIAEASAAEKAAIARGATAKAQLEAMIGDAEAGKLPSGALVRWKLQKRAEHVVAASEFRVLRGPWSR